MDHVGYRAADGVATLVLDRPQKLNALTIAMLEAIEHHVRNVDRDPAIRVLLVHGTGRAFSVGADVDAWSKLTPQEFRYGWIQSGHRCFEALARCRVPVIAAIHGMAFGGGLELALAADLRVCEGDAMLALPETTLGTVPGWGGTRRLADLVGSSRAKQMVLAGERISGTVGERWGLVNRVCGSGEALGAAGEMARAVAAAAPVAVQIGKRLIDGAAGEDVNLVLEMLGGMATQETADLKEGIAAMRAKRSATFRGE